jgi:hypothetical protein
MHENARSTDTLNNKPISVRMVQRPDVEGVRPFFLFSTPFFSLAARALGD